MLYYFNEEANTKKIQYKQATYIQVTYINKISKINADNDTFLFHIFLYLFLFVI